MKKIRSIIFILSVSLLATLCTGAAAAATEPAGASSENAFSGNTDYVGEGFLSGLPLIILEVPDSEIIAGAEESVAALMKTVDSGGDNRPDGEPRYSAEILLDAIRYENDEPRPKRDYFISVAGGGATVSGSPLSGLEPGGRWFLLGGAYDKSLIRNYLGYTLAGRILDDAPAVRLCELFLKNSGGYEYQGVYLLVEGSGGGGVVTARRTEHYWEGFNQTVVSDGGSGVFVLQDNWGGSSDAASMGAAIDEVSGMFDSGDTNYYLQYGKVLDLESFYAYFLVNELMASYEGMNESIYSYDINTRKLSVGPVWNFERALDNQRDEAINLRRLQYQKAPFYRKMIIDSEFINGLISAGKDYAVLLSGAEISRLIDLAVAELGDAQKRDWRKWQSFYLGEENALSGFAPVETDAGIGANGIGYDESGALMVETTAYYKLPENAPERIRQLTTYGQEIIKLKFYASERPAVVRRAMLLFKNQEELLTEVNAYGKNTMWALLFLAGFILTIILARKTAER